MNKGLVGGIAFVAGAALGCLATRQYFKTKYEKIADEEIESVKSVFRDDLDKANEAHLQTLNQAQEMNEAFRKAQKQKEEDRKEYRGVLNEVNYSGYSKDSEDEEEEDSEMRDPTKPYIIDEDEFGQFEGYKQVYVTYYADDILVDQDDDIIMDAEDQFGYDCLKLFDDDNVAEIYVRNEMLETEYNIVQDAQNYSDFYNNPDIDMDEY